MSFRTSMTSAFKFSARCSAHFCSFSSAYPDCLCCPWDALNHKKGTRSTKRRPAYPPALSCYTGQVSNRISNSVGSRILARIFGPSSACRQNKTVKFESSITNLLNLGTSTHCAVAHPIAHRVEEQEPSHRCLPSQKIAARSIF